MKFSKLIITILVFTILLVPIGNFALAEEQGIGIKNDLNTSNKEAMNSLPSDSELEEQTKGHKADIVEAGQSKKIKKEKGGLWKAYKDEIKEEIKKRKDYDPNADSMKDFAKKYDTSKGQLDVGKFDVNGHINNFLLQCGSSLIKWGTSLLKDVTIKPSDVLEAPSAQPLMTSFSSLTDMLLALFLVYQVLKIMLVRAVDIGYSGQIIYDKVLKTFVATTLIGLYEPIFKLAMNFQYLLVSPIFKSVEVKDNTASLVAFKSLMVDGVAPMIVMAIAGVLFMVITLSMFYSLAMFIILYIIGPVAITTMVNDDMEFFSLWLRKLVGRILTLLLQSLCVAMSFATLMRITFKYQQSLTDIMLGFAFLFVALGVPKMLENFGDSSGAGRSALIMVRGMGRRR